LGTTDVFNPDYEANTSPFTLNDVTSRAAQLGIKQRGRQGSGQNKKRHGKKRWDMFGLQMCYTGVKSNPARPDVKMFTLRLFDRTVASCYSIRI
jgi:hypothetical protein